MATAPKGKTQWLAGGGIAQAGGRSALLVLAQALGSKSTGTRTAAARARLKLEEAILPDVQRSLAGAGEAAAAAAGLVTVSSIMSGKKEVSKAGPALHAATSAPDSGTEQPSFFAKWTDNQRRSCVSSGGYHRYADHPSISPEQ